MTSNDLERRFTTKLHNLHIQCQSRQCLTDTKSHSEMVCVVICSKPHSLRQMQVIIPSHSHFREISVTNPILMGFPWDPWDFPMQAHL